MVLLLIPNGNGLFCRRPRYAWPSPGWPVMRDDSTTVYGAREGGRPTSESFTRRVTHSTLSQVLVPKRTEHRDIPYIYKKLFNRQGKTEDWIFTGGIRVTL